MGRLSNVIAEKMISRMYRMMDVINDDIDFSKISINDGLKYSIINDPYFKLVKTGKSSFAVAVENERLIAEAIICDFVLSHQRRNIQNQKLLNMNPIKKDVSPAWEIITSYYSAFFCATDISRILNMVNLNLTSEEVSLVERKAGFDHEELKGLNGFSGVVSAGFGKIIFHHTKSKPHQYAWSNLKSCLKTVFRNKEDWPEVNVLLSILSGENGWEYPSSIRNEWNYIDPYLYGSKGIEMGKEFLKLSSNPSSSEGWLTSNFIWKGKSSSAASIGVLSDVLYKASDEAYRQFFSDDSD